MFEVGDVVTWASSASGSCKEKTGVVEHVLPPRQDPRDVTRELDAPGLPRAHVSYLVRVPGKTPRAKGKLYWPVADKLRAA